MTHRVVNKTDVRTPACLAAVDGAEFRLALVCGPECVEVEIEICERGKLLAQLTRAHVAVVIDDGGCLACRTRESPRSWLLEVCVLGAVVSDDRAGVNRVLHEALARIVCRKHPLAVALCQFRNVRVHGRQNL